MPVLCFSTCLYRKAGRAAPLSGSLPQPFADCQEGLGADGKVYA